MIDYCSFKKFKENCWPRTWEETLDIYQLDDPIYKRIKCVYEENLIWVECEKITHRIDFCVNSDNGEIFFDCSRIKLFTKHVAICLYAPLKGIAKSIHHIVIVVREVFTCLENRDFKDLNDVEFIYHLKNIYRSPLYGIGISALCLRGIFAAPFDPNSLYASRDRIGKFEAGLFETKYFYRDKWAIAPCFCPLRTLFASTEANSLHSVEQNKNMLLKLVEVQIASMRNESHLFGNWAKMPYPKAYSTFTV